MKNPRTIAFLCAACCVALLALAPAFAPLALADETGAGNDATGPWLRIYEDEDRVLYLDVAARTFEPAEGAGPRITLAGAVHVGESRFYKTLQEFLDAHDLVLYEGVNPPGSGELPPGASARERVAQTKARMRLVAILLERYHEEHGAYPDSLDDLAAALASHKRQAHWLEGARIDAWDQPLRYAPSDDGAFSLTSLGADAEPGGRKADADLEFSDQEPLSEGELGTAPGIQQRLAETFRLKFQLDEMDESKDHWRNADMDVDQLQRRMGLTADPGAGDEGGQGPIIFDLLDGSSGTARMASMFLRIIETLPGAAPRGRLMIMEMLSVADESMLAASMPDGEQVIGVIIGDRNQVVVDELREAIDAEPEHERIGVIYGAGHMPDLEQRLMDQLGYRFTGETLWHTAMRLPLERVGISETERMMLRATLLKQLSDLEKMRSQ